MHRSIPALLAAGFALAVLAAMTIFTVDLRSFFSLAK